MSEVRKKLSVEKIIALAKNEGFDLMGVAPIKKFDQKGYYQKYLAEGFEAKMKWLEKSQEIRRDPAQAFPEANSIVSLAINYFPGRKVNQDYYSGGIIGRFAWLNDYHQIIKMKLDNLSNRINRLVGEKVCLKSGVDAAALLEKEIAQEAGLGFIGKNTQLITRDYGSFVFLAEIILKIKLPQASHLIANQCGLCQKCLAACPTSALTKPFVLDARKCISYLTIENRGTIPLKLRSKIGTNIFGCDFCQEVCPYNKQAKPNRHPFFKINQSVLNKSLLDWLTISENEYSKTFKNSPLKRCGYTGLIRNVIVALGNQGSPKSLPQLKSYLKSSNKLLADHALWSIKRILKTSILK